MKHRILFSFNCLVGLLLTAEACAQADSALPRRIVALQYTALHSQTVTVISPEAAEFNVLPGNDLGHEGQLQMKFRLKNNWYAVGGLAVGQVRHQLGISEGFSLGVFSLSSIYQPTSRTLLAPYNHVSASAGLEYHHPIDIRERFVPYFGLSLQHSTFLPRATEPAPISFREFRTGNERQLSISYSDTRRSALGYHLTLGIQWMLGQHIVVAAHISNNQNRLDILRGSQFRLYDQQTLLRAGRLQQRHGYFGYGLAVGYRW